MSGSPKRAQLGLSAMRRAQIEAQRQRQEELEREKRKQREALERARQIQTLRAEIATACSEWERVLNEAVALGCVPSENKQRLETIRSSAPTVRDLHKLMDLRDDAQTGRRELGSVVAEGRRRKEMERIRQERERALAELEQCRAHLVAIEGESVRFDLAGRKQLHQQIDVLERQLASSNVPARKVLDGLTEMMARHEQTIRAAEAQCRAALAIAQQIVMRMEAEMIGLAEDEVVLRWETAALQELASVTRSARAALEAEDMGRVSEIQGRFDEAHQSMLERANVSQLRDEERRTIVDGLQRALTEMGFYSEPPRLEHAAYPESALILNATNSSLQTIGISVPVEGEVWYEVHGFDFEARRVGQETFSTCDKAADTLGKLHEQLKAFHGIKAGEILWDGKPPDGMFHREDELPRSENQLERER